MALTDVPASYSGEALNLARVNAGETALEFFTIAHSDLTGVGSNTHAQIDTHITNALVDADFGSAGLMATDGAGAYSIVTDNSANWNTAYGWGDHSVAGYLTSGTALWTKAGTSLSPTTAGDDVTLNYVLKNENGEVVYTEQEVKTIDTNLDFMKLLSLPARLSLGKYFLYVQVEYQDKVASASTDFEVGAEGRLISIMSWFKPNLWKIVIFLSSLTIIFVVFVIYYKKRKEGMMINQNLSSSIPSSS